jgi:8-oxo-dGTP pyrophosphatase MutT (NUDIX family)
MSNHLRKAVIRGLAAAPHRPFQGEYRARSAVLVGIAERDGVPCFLLTRRTNTVSTHKGQVSFPGGRREEGDGSLEETALRETFEEVGIRSESIEIVGRLHDYLAVTHSRVTPFAGFINGSPQVTPCAAEVARVLWVPLRFFLETEPRIEIWERLGQRVSVHFFDFEEEVIWGLTARMIIDFLETIGPGIRRLL